MRKNFSEESIHLHGKVFIIFSYLYFSNILELFKKNMHRISAAMQVFRNDYGMDILTKNKHRKSSRERIYPTGSLYCYSKYHI
jgi:hypothetical protein